MTEEVSEVLFQKGTLIDLHIGKPTFQKKLRQNDLLASIDENVIYLGHKKLLPPTAMEKLTTLEGRGRAALAERSISFPIAGTRFVHIRSLPEVLTKLGGLREEWNEEVESLVSKYPALVEKQLGELDEQCKKLMESELKKFTGVELEVRTKELGSWMNLQKATNRMLYPDQASLKQLFKFQWTMFKISPVTGFEELNQASQEDLAKAQRELQNSLKAWVKEAAGEVHKTLGQAALNASRMLEANGKLNARSIKPLFDAFETFAAVDFTGTSGFRTVIDNIKKSFEQTNRDGGTNYSRTADAVNNSETARQAFGDLIRNVASLAQDTVAAEAGLKSIIAGEFGRSIEV